MDIDWSKELAEQLDWHWQNQLRPRLDGLTDAEYRPGLGGWASPLVVLIPIALLPVSRLRGVGPAPGPRGRPREDGGVRPVGFAARPDRSAKADNDFGG